MLDVTNVLLKGITNLLVNMVSLEIGPLSIQAILLRAARAPAII